MGDKLYYRELECYSNAPESLLWEIGRKDYFDLSQLPTETMKYEFAQYIRMRGKQVSLSSIFIKNTIYIESAGIKRVRWLLLY